MSTPLTWKDYIRFTDQKGQYALAFTDCLYVTYRRGFGNTDASTITFLEPYAFFDNNGVIINPRSNVVEGSWSSDRMANMLPVDYDPAVN